MARFQPARPNKKRRLEMLTRRPKPNPSSRQIKRINPSRPLRVAARANYLYLYRRRREPPPLLLLPPFLPQPLAPAPSLSRVLSAAAAAARWCSGSPTESVTATRPSPTRPGSSRPQVRAPLGFIPARFGRSLWCPDLCVCSWWC